MRNVLLAILTTVCVASCGDDDTGPVKVLDMAMGTGGDMAVAGTKLTCTDLLDCTNPVSGGGMCPDGQDCTTACEKKASTTAVTDFNALTNCIIMQCGKADGDADFLACELRSQCFGTPGMDLMGCDGMPKGACNDALTACGNQMN